MRKPITGLAVTAAVAAAGLALATAPSGPAHSKTLVYCSEGDPSGFNPSLFTDGTTFDASSRQIYNRLVEFDRGTTNIIPALAESWDVSEDGLTYTFSLRGGVKFHSSDAFTPSREFNADDVIYTFERQLRDDHPFHTVSGGTYEYFVGMSMDSLIGDI